MKFADGDDASSRGQVGRSATCRHAAVGLIGCRTKCGVLGQPEPGDHEPGRAGRATSPRAPLRGYGARRSDRPTDERPRFIGRKEEHRLKIVGALDPLARHGSEFRPRSKGPVDDLQGRRTPQNFTFSLSLSLDFSPLSGPRRTSGLTSTERFRLWSRVLISTRGLDSSLSSMSSNWSTCSSI